jgi:AraC-like DNA-binding protein
MLKIHPKNLSRYNTAFKELVQIWERKKLGYEMRAVRCVSRLLSYMIEEDQSDWLDSSPVFSRLLTAKEYIDGNCFETINLESLANMCNMSITNFRRRFSEAFGVSPMLYRDKQRILYAKDYLACGYFSVTETAYKCGFNDVSYFCRFFKKHVGVSPMRYAND